MWEKTEITGSQQIYKLSRMQKKKKKKGLPRWLSIPWKGKWQPNPVFLPGKPHGQRKLVGYSFAQLTKKWDKT